MSGFIPFLCPCLRLPDDLIKYEAPHYVIYCVDSLRRVGDNMLAMDSDYMGYRKRKDM
jgi:hypothetical protein